MWVVFFAVLLVLSTSFVYAGTKVTIKTLQYHQVEVIVADGTIQDYSKIGNFKGDADQYGDFTFNVDTNKALINLYVHVKRYDEEISNEKFIGEKTGSPIYREVAPEGYELLETPKITQNVTITNATLLDANETANTTNLEELTDSKVTGSTVSSFFTSQTFYYGTGVIIILIIAFFAIRFYRKRRSNNGGQEIRVKKLSEVQQEKTDDYKGVIDDAERKIKEAQDELRRLRNEDQKIKAMRRKIAEDENELIKLRRGAGFG